MAQPTKQESWWQQDGKILREVVEEGKATYFSGWCWSGKILPDGTQLEFNAFTEETRIAKYNH
jgi:hypothetical protein